MEMVLGKGKKIGGFWGSQSQREEEEDEDAFFSSLIWGVGFEQRNCQSNQL